MWKGYPLTPGQVGSPEARARCGCTLASLSESAATPAGAGGGPTWPNHLRNCGLSETTILTNLSPYASLTLVLRAAPSANDRYARSIRTDAGCQPGSDPVGKFGGGDGFCVKAETLAVASEERSGHLPVSNRNAVPVGADPRRHWLAAPPP